MHEYFAISVHFVVFYTVFNQKPWHFATFSRKIIRLSDNLGEVMITQRFHHFITRQYYLLLKTDILRRGSNLQFIRSRSYVPLTIASMRIITKLISIELDAYSLGFARIERDAGKALQLDRMNLLVALSWRQIYLRYLIGMNVTRIGNLKVDIAAAFLSRCISHRGSFF